MCGPAFSHVIVILGEGVRLVAANTRPGATFHVEGTAFHEITAQILTATGDATGFQDWLRGRWRRVVGIRFTPLDSPKALIQRLESHPAVRAVPGGLGIEIKFIQSAHWKTWVDADQILSDCRIYEAQPHVTALVVSADYAGWAMRRMISGFIS